MIVQTPLFKPQTEWVPPQKFPNLKESKMITVDIETCDEELKVKGPGWPQVMVLSQEWLSVLKIL